MPPKNKNKKDKKDKKEDDDKKEAKEERATERELVLEKELNMLTDELEIVKRRVSQLKEDNELLEQEAQTIQNESQEYMSYMNKKASMRQNSIITLSDQNRKEIEEIQSQKEKVIKDFEEKKEMLKLALIEKQHSLTKINKELENMNEFKQLKIQQTDEIQSLEDEIKKLRAQQQKEISDLKAEFIMEKEKTKEEAEKRIQEVIRAANSEARECLTENTRKIKMDNQQLRKDLLTLLQNTKALTAHRAELEKQRNEILKEISYAEDLKKLRTNRQEQVIQKLFSKNQYDDYDDEDE